MEIDSAIMIARVFGPFMGILGLWMLLYGENIIKVMGAVKSAPAALYSSAVFNLLLGVFIITNYNVWEWDIFLFVTLLGWAMFVRSLFAFFIPQFVVKIIMTKNSWIKTMGIIPFVWGLILTWAGFYV